MRSKASTVSLIVKSTVILFLILTVGCATRTVEIVHTSLEPEYIASEGVPRIATEKKIPITIGGKRTEMSLPGHVALHPRDWQVILDDINEDSDE